MMAAIFGPVPREAKLVPQRNPIGLRRDESLKVPTLDALTALERLAALAARAAAMTFVRAGSRASCHTVAGAIAHGPNPHTTAASNPLPFGFSAERHPLATSSGKSRGCKT
jgi:hypothetical protein